MLEQMGIAAKAASYKLALLSSGEKNRVLEKIADELEAQMESILSANVQDVEQARANGLSEAMLDRLTLTPARLKAIADDVRQVCNLADPVGQVIDGGLLDSGLRLERRRVPLGVVGVIYEARPNVTVDVASLCLKTGNAVILRGGKETHRTNAATVRVIQKALKACGLPEAAVQAIDNPDRSLVNEMLRMDKYIDMLIPRGGAGLHKLCREQSTIPVITGGIGVCHIFVDSSADIAPALKIIVNAKTQRPSTCNTVETLLVHQDIAERFLPVLSKQMAESGVTLHGDETVMQLHGPAKLVPLKPEELDNEFLSLDLNVVVVENMDGAIAHIREHGTQHSDAILTCDMHNAARFVNEVDSAAVYVNASTRFTDGGQFGLGAEVAVSTQKLHARGPMGLEALTTYKWIGFGDGTIRA
ncbi:TPA_asm: glutamate-5-semialdehyde dehydrogenase [Salmonella enterica subsp. enterica]|uniref:Gamma-glutamyl phosphate reductase n=1 Tax=Salmonella enterica subsp. enterica serovar Karamoja TaxID=2500153 RepID=A0A3Q9MYL2_SALET|nr:glutamate-5-semialdehyde dehydrogenase [Salmonella enterica subsp. enterica serovar Karamoja]EAA2975786.1 glutamate-5-semialdehyde dehydrogenase [Salmonella enterica subsp. enterica serovar Mbao]EAW1736721.1 glutamate-5-semialdehyde dehydrogenase [Salmonella enterica subsp. enterica]EBK3241498.1 glutamate-5-semialdehyde dehydrogenase [Salmonella enterica]EBR0431379.1 glutamate-5-semialdehyde dehydrogenase [Salmonella enterica subsp. enterica serovar Vejle]EBS3368559.1 glutamate-5-semialdehy